MKLNEIGQILLPLSGITKELMVRFRVKLEEVGSEDERGSEFNKFNYVVFIKFKTNIEFEHYCIKNLRVACHYDDYLGNTVIGIKPLERYKEDWRQIMCGKYSKVNKSTLYITILPNVSDNKDIWEGIFNKTDEGIKRYLSNKLKGSNSIDQEKHINHTLIEMKELGYIPELFPSIKSLKYKINEGQSNKQID